MTNETTGRRVASEGDPAQASVDVTRAMSGAEETEAEGTEAEGTEAWRIGEDETHESGETAGDGDAEEKKILGATDDTPPVPDEIREAGRLAPDHWLGMVDPTWSGEGEPPEWAMVGRWRSGLDGEIEEWQDNPEYKPSPRALGWPEPEDEVDEAVQLAATGYGPGEDVPKALVGREVAILTQPDGSPLAAVTPDGTAVVPLFSSPVYLHTAGRFAFELVNADNLVKQVPAEHKLYVNPSAAVSMTLELDVLSEAVDAAASGHEGGVPTVSADAGEASMTTLSLDSGIAEFADATGTGEEAESAENETEAESTAGVGPVGKKSAVRRTGG